MTLQIRANFLPEQRFAEAGSTRVRGKNLGSRAVLIREGIRQAIDRSYHIMNCSFGMPDIACLKAKSILRHLAAPWRTNVSRPKSLTP
jgi:hypothetical protein